MRKAFSMITAIFVILIMATLAAFILNISSKAVSTTLFQYKKEQAVLYAKSYTELAILAATANDSNVTNCAENINAYVDGTQTEVRNGKGYEVQTRIAYIGNGLACSGTRILTPGNTIITPNETQIIVDVYVRYRDPSAVAAAGIATGAPWVTYHRRTLQKL
ncbi:hypothetical protein [Sulfurovum riftiae]|uniref:Type II secretion system protein n=1 Tax=Sulfurovum riftiae TaxID=1630136 RepID=A0A151CFI2_9BACT|nr:hypothetical protein [Sulfurovum riftiae]KYJ86290.1 hypothetical protein AS592_05700 [Sulfurovum riftiae]